MAAGMPGIEQRSPERAAVGMEPSAAIHGAHERYSLPFHFTFRLVSSSGITINCTM